MGGEKAVRKQIKFKKCQSNKLTYDSHSTKWNGSRCVWGPPVGGKHSCGDNSERSFANGLINNSFGRHYFWKWWHRPEITQSMVDLICVNPSGGGGGGRGGTTMAGKTHFCHCVVIYFSPILHFFQMISPKNSFSDMPPSQRSLQKYSTSHRVKGWNKQKILLFGTAKDGKNTITVFSGVYVAPEY